MARAIISEEAQVAAIQRPEKRTSFSVLVVDDDPMVLELMQEYLRESCNVITANSGEEAVSKMRSVQVDIALVDLKMPGMDGLETIEKMAASDPDTITILMTGFPNVDSSVKAIRLGASNYVLKPFKWDEINLAISKAANEHELKQEIKSLRKRVQELEKGISDKKDSIKVNQKVAVISTPEGYSARIATHEPESPKPRTE